MEGKKNFLERQITESCTDKARQKMTLNENSTSNSLMDKIFSNNLFQASFFSKGCSGKCAKRFSTTLNCLLTYASVSLEYLLDLVIHDYMLLIMVYIVY